MRDGEKAEVENVKGFRQKNLRELKRRSTLVGRLIAIENAIGFSLLIILHTSSPQAPNLGSPPINLLSSDLPSGSIGDHKVAGTSSWALGI